MNARFVPFLLALCSPLAAAQSMNLKCGFYPNPSPTYGAASGQVGTWNRVTMPSPATALVDLNGQPTAAVYTADNCNMGSCSDCIGALCTGFTGTVDDSALLGSWFY